MGHNVDRELKDLAGGVLRRLGPNGECRERDESFYAFYPHQKEGEKAMDGTARTVFIVHGCWDSRLRLSHGLTRVGYRTRSFDSAECFLAALDAKTPGCVLSDIVLPGMSGLDLQCVLVGSPNPRPLVFLSDQADIETGVQAMKRGAIDLLTKPISTVRLFEAIEQALRHDADQRGDRAICSGIKERLESLTRREQQVMAHVIQGPLNKQIAAGLGTGVKTVKVHRARVMSKMGARSVAELVRLGARIGTALEPTLAANSSRLSWRLSLNAEEWKSDSPALARAMPNVPVVMTERLNGHGAAPRQRVFNDFGRVGASVGTIRGSEEIVRWAISTGTSLPNATSARGNL
jgi:FixJ family two-component response regulator